MDLSNKTILICDDSILARKQLMDSISAFCENMTFLEAKNGVEAVSIYKEQKPAITFLDIVMPEENGIDALKDIMEHDSEALIIIVSSLGTQAQLKTAIEIGAKDFIQKPFDSTQIQKVLEARLGGN